MIKNTVFAIFVITSLFVLFTNVGFEIALSIVGKGLDMLISYVNTIH
jgi:hypothetical protein